MSVPPIRSAAKHYFNDSQRVGPCCKIGWLTSRCQTTAHKPSVCGVIRSANSGGTTMQTSACWRVKPPSRPTMPKTRPALAWPARSRERYWSRYSSPGCRPRRRKLASHPWRRGESRLSQLEKQVSQPSSLTRAVSSETLSVGAYASKPHSLRKSLTAWPAWPAEPPTPRMKSRPPPARTSASP